MSPGGFSLLVGARGFEPPTSCSQSRRATGLRYAPTISLKSFGVRGDLSLAEEPWPDG